MSATVSLTEALADGRAAVECSAVELKGSTAWLHPADSDRTLVVPMDNIAGVEGGEVDRAVEQIPTQGGQVTEVVTEVS